MQTALAGGRKPNQTKKERKGKEKIESWKHKYKPKAKTDGKAKVEKQEYKNVRWKRIEAMDEIALTDAKAKNCVYHRFREVWVQNGIARYSVVQKQKSKQFWARV